MRPKGRIILEGVVPTKPSRSSRRSSRSSHLPVKICRA